MKTYTITDAAGRRVDYAAESQASALRQHTSAYPGVSVLGIIEGSTYRAQETQTQAD